MLVILSDGQKGVWGKKQEWAREPASDLSIYVCKYVCMDVYVYICMYFSLVVIKLHVETSL